MLSNKQTQITCKYFTVEFECFDLIKHLLCVFSELKSQYAEQPTSGTNINELPQLLQAIHTHKPTVFKSGGPQYQQRSKDFLFFDSLVILVK